MPVAVAAVAGIAAGVAVSSVAIGVAVGLGTVALSSALKPDVPDVSVDPVSDQQLTTSANQPRRIIYGETVTGCQLIGYRKIEQNGDEFYVLVLKVADTPCESLSLYEIEGKPAAEIADEVTARYYTGTQTAACPLALEHAFGWTPNHIGYGITYATLKVRIDADIISSINDIKFLVRGKKVYDPRQDSTKGGAGPQRVDDPATWTYSANPQLCAVDYTRFHGHKIAHERRFDWDAVALFASHCDEQISYTTHDANTEAETRYECHGVLNTALTPGEGLRHILATFGGKPYRVGGKIYFKPAMYTGIATTTIDVAGPEIIGTPAYRPHRPQKERANLVRGQHMAPDKKWQMTDAPVVTDGTSGNLEASLRFPLVKSETQTQRLCKRKLERLRAGFVATIKLRGVRLDCAPGNNIRLVDSEYGINSEFVIDEMSVDNVSRTTTLTLEEEHPDMFTDDWTPTQGDITPNSSLPSSTLVSKITDLEYTPTHGDSHRLGLLTWEHPTPSSVVRYAVYLYDENDENENNGSEKTAIANLPTLARQVDITSLAPGDYSARVIAINRHGRSSVAVETGFAVAMPHTPTEYTLSQQPGSATIVPEKPWPSATFKWWVSKTEGQFGGDTYLGEAARQTILTEHDTVFHVQYALKIGDDTAEPVQLQITGLGIVSEQLDPSLADPIARAAEGGTIDQAVEGVNQRVEDANDRIDDASDQLTDAEQRIDVLQNTSDFDSINLRIEQLTERANNFAITLGSAVSLVESVQDALDLVQTVDVIDEALGITDDDGNPIAVSNFVQYQQKLDEMESRHTTTVTKVTAVDEQVKIQQNQIEISSDKIAQMTAQLESLGTEEQIQALRSELDAANNAIRHSSISAMYGSSQSFAGALQAAIDTAELAQAQVTLAYAEQEIQTLTEDGKATAKLTEQAVTMAADGQAGYQRAIELVSETNRQQAKSVEELTAHIGDTAATTGQEQITYTDQELTLARQEIFSEILSGGDTILAELSLVSLKTEDEALAQSIQNVQSSFNGQLATVNSTLTSLATEDESLAQSVLNVQASFNGQLATVNTTLAGLATEDLSLAQSITDVQASFNGQLATVNTTLAGLATEDLSLAQSITDVHANFNGQLAAVNATLTSLATEDLSLAQSITDVHANFNGQLATVNNTLAAQASQDAVLAATLSANYVELNDSIASASVAQQAYAAAAVASSATDIFNQIKDGGTEISAGLSLNALSDAVNDNSASFASVFALAADANTTATSALSLSASVQGNLSGALALYNDVDGFLTGVWDVNTGEVASSELLFKSGRISLVSDALDIRSASTNELAMDWSLQTGWSYNGRMNATKGLSVDYNAAFLDVGYNVSGQDRDWVRMGRNNDYVLIRDAGIEFHSDGPGNVTSWRGLNCYNGFLNISNSDPGHAALITQHGSGRILEMRSGQDVVAYVTTAGQFISASSIKYKHIHHRATNVLDRVCQIGREGTPIYTRFGSDDLQIGQIAEEWLLHFPEAVTFDNEGRVAGLDYKAVASVSITALSQQQDIIAHQDKRISEQSKQLTNLEQQLTQKLKEQGDQIAQILQQLEAA